MTWTRNLALVACNFQQITAHFDLDGTGQVTTKELTKREVIEVSPPSQSQSTGQAGFIGEGFTKRGIYVSRQFIKLFELQFSPTFDMDVGAI